MSRPLRVATRTSRLALWQTKQIVERLDCEVEFVPIETTGDKRRDVPIEHIRGRGVFVKEVQAAVLEDRADFSVHSAKDLQSTPVPGLDIICVIERGDPRDAMVGKSLGELPPGASVATGSIRRRAQLALLRPDLVFSDLRGNIDTRLLRGRAFDAAVMALAPLRRLGFIDHAEPCRSGVNLQISVLDASSNPDADRNDEHGQSHDQLRDQQSVTVCPLSIADMLPQVGQGALVAECRSNDDEVREMLSSLDHEESHRCIDAERAFLAELGGGCDVPVAAHAVVKDNSVVMRTLVSSGDGRIALRQQGSHTDGVALGKRLAHKTLYDDGGAELLLWYRGRY